MRVVIVVLDPPSSDRARKIMGLLEELAGLGAGVSVYFGGRRLLEYKGMPRQVANYRGEFFVEEGDLEARGIRGKFFRKGLTLSQR